MYFEELFDLKKQQIDLGESEEGTMDLMGTGSTISLFTILIKSRTNDKGQLRILHHRFQDW
jgi:hypothetical protein